MIDENTLEFFRENLPYYRAFAGWSLEDLAELLDISRATMVRIENVPGTLKTLHFLAIQKLIENEFVRPHGNTMLANAVVILDDPDNHGNSRISRTELIDEINGIREKVGKKFGAKGLCKACNDWLLYELGIREVKQNGR